MIFHIPGIPHTVTNKQYISCAYTQKIFKLCAMLTKLGHTVYHYGCEGSNPTCTEHIDVVNEDLRSTTYPDDFHTNQFKFDQSDICYKTFHENTVIQIKKRQSKKDFLLCGWGWGHEPIASQLDSSILVVESGIGYESTFATYRIFESYTWMSYVYGLQKQNNGIFYDCVIPNFFDPADFTYQEKKEKSYLYLGRFVKRKGVELAMEVIKEIGGNLLIAGQGKFKNNEEGIKFNTDNTKWIGFADLEKRRNLLSKTRALLVPTYYIEPFGGVAIEAMLSGTPVISTDWGVFSENILHGITGYRCHTFDHFCWAAHNIHNISSKACQEWALSNFTCDRVSEMYQEYFNMLYNLWDKGWYTKNKQRSNLNWLTKTFPKTH